jgi:hypothetical protein
VERDEKVATPELAACEVPVNVADGVEARAMVAEDVATTLP